MSYTDDLAPGTALLGRAIGHASFLYGEPVTGYNDILCTALHGGRHAGPSRSRVSDTAVKLARDLISQADSGVLDRDIGGMLWWIGSATALLRELTRDA